MSAELFEHRYLYRPRSKLTLTGGKKLSFLQNFLHDAESLWWIALWSLARLDPADRNPPLEGEALSRRQKQYLQWFPSNTRRYGNAFDVPLANGEEHLERIELPEAYLPILDTLVAWRYTVAQHIDDTENVQGGISHNGMKYLDLHVKCVIASRNWGMLGAVLHLSYKITH
jgi:hypothetical protein